MTTASPPTTLDTRALKAYLSDYLVLDGELRLEKFSGGQSNPTFALSAGERKYVLRKQPHGQLLKSAHAVDREYRVINALQDTAVPVPRVYHLCEDKEVIGSMFYVMEYVDGSIYWNSALPDVADNDTRTAMYQSMNTVLADLHSVDIDKVGLSDYGRSGNYFERQLSRWTKQYEQSQTRHIEQMSKLMDWLDAELPDDDGQLALVHGDFRLDNMMFDTNTHHVNAVLDWELSTLGHPYADLAYQCMQLRLPATVGHAPGLGGADRHALGIPDEATYVEWYRDKRGLDTIEHWPFYLAFSFFRLAAIAQGVAKRAKTGNASNKEAAKVGDMVQPLATLALEMIEQEG